MRWRFAANALERLRRCSAAMRMERVWRAHKWMGSETQFRFSGGRYANGNHILGSRCGTYFFTGNRVVGRGADLWASVPIVLRLGQIGAGGSGSETGTKTLKQKFVTGEHYAGAEVFADRRRAGNDFRG